MSDPTIDAIEKALDMVCDLCKPKNIAGAKEWIMSIPAQPDKDPDLVIANGLREAKKRIAMLEKQRDNHWISVDERLPEPGKVVLTIGSHRDPVTAFHAMNRARLTGVDGRAYKWYTVEDEDHVVGITHWMPIPEVKV